MQIQLRPNHRASQKDKRNYHPADFPGDEPAKDHRGSFYAHLERAFSNPFYENEVHFGYNFSQLNESADPK